MNQFERANPTVDETTDPGAGQEQSDVQERMFDIEIEGDDDTPPTAFTPVMFSQSIRRISDLYSSRNDHELDTNPAFQRGYVWDTGKASRLIESVLLHVPLPIVYTAEEEDGREVVIDGQQRLTTFFAFLDGRWPRGDKPFKLTKLKLLPHLNGMTFKELPADLQRAFRTYGVSIVKIGAGSNQNVKFEIFERLNTGSVTLSEQELRNCIYRGPLNEMLKRMAKHDTFIKCMGMSRPIDRMLDVEIVLRFCAFYERTYLNYTSPMKKFLNEFMSNERNASPEKLKKLEEAFKLACDNTYTVFGDKAFRRYSLGNANNEGGRWEAAPNRALFDVIMGWFARYEKRQIIPVKDAIREKFIKTVTENTNFQEAITLGTNDVARVRSRFEIWKLVLDQVISAKASEQRLFSLSEKQKLFEADPTCKICGQRIEALDDAEVDHIEQYAHGGATSWENARLAHRFCNKSRPRL